MNKENSGTLILRTSALLRNVWQYSLTQTPKRIVIQSVWRQRSLQLLPNLFLHPSILHGKPQRFLESIPVWFGAYLLEKYTILIFQWGKIGDKHWEINLMANQLKTCDNQKRASQGSLLPTEKEPRFICFLQVNCTCGTSFIFFNTKTHCKTLASRIIRRVTTPRSCEVSKHNQKYWDNRHMLWEQFHHASAALHSSIWVKVTGKNQALPEHD